MELGLSLGERASKPSFGLMDKPTTRSSLGFCMAISNSNSTNFNRRKLEDEDEDEDDEADYETEEDDPENQFKNKRIKKVFPNHLCDQQQKDCSKHSPLIQLDLLPNTPVPRHNQHPLLCSSSHHGLDVNRMPAAAAEEGEEGGAISSSPPNSAASSFQMDFSIYNKSVNVETERASSRASDEDENGSCRKKLRLSKEQSAFLEESFKEHNTLNPKQKLALAKQLNLRPRQVEVWFQNRRARTKLKQTEVDCEYLKRCCETLTEENRKLHKELQELRALKNSNPFYLQLPATTLTMCPSCERVATTSAAAPTTNNNSTSKPTDLSLTTNPTFHPFNHPKNS